MCANCQLEIFLLLNYADNELYTDSECSDSKLYINTELSTTPMYITLISDSNLKFFKSNLKLDININWNN